MNQSRCLGFLTRILPVVIFLASCLPVPVHASGTTVQSKAAAQKPAIEVAPPGGTFSLPLKITMKIAKGYTIYYTTDNSVPSKKKTKYTKAIPITKSTTLKYIFINSKGVASKVFTEKYKFVPAPAKPASPPQSTSAPTPAATPESIATPTPTPTPSPSPTPTPSPTKEISDSYIKTTPRLESDHFLFYCNEEDTTCLEDLKKSLEGNYDRITSDLKAVLSFKVKVMIYPDLVTYHKAIGYPEAPDWSVGSANGNDVRMVSPLKPGPSHSYSSLMQVVVHEFTHVVTNNLSNYISSAPVWLREGVSSYEAYQMSEGRKASIRPQILSNTVPSLENLNSKQFSSLHGYEYGYTIVDFIIREYGYDKLNEYLRDVRNFKLVFGMELTEFESKWKQFLEHNYSH